MQLRARSPQGASRTHRFLTISALTFLALTFATTVASAQKSATFDTLTMRIGTDWVSFDPMVDMRTGVLPETAPIYDRLVAWNAKYTDVIPYIATSWTQTSKSITFHVRQDAKCSDGHVMNAVDILNSFKRLLTVPKRSGSVVNAPIGGLGPGPYHLHASIKRGTFTLNVDKPWRDKLTLFAMQPIICPSGLAAYAADSHALDNTGYGSGPYTVVSATHGDKVVYQLRPEWKWGPAGSTTATMAHTLVLKLVSDDTTAANLLVTGGLDVGQVSGENAYRLDTVSTVQHLVQPIFTPHTVLFSQRAGSPFVDESLRAAISTAIDPKLWNKAALGGTGRVASSMFRTGSQCWDAKTPALMPKPSTDTAKQMLATAGWTLSNGQLTKNGQQLKVTILTNQVMAGGPDYLASVLNSLGIAVTLNNLPAGAYGTAFLAGNFDMTVQRGQNPVPFPGPSMANVWGNAPSGSPPGSNVGSIGLNDAEYQRDAIAANQNAANCKYWDLVQEIHLKKHYVLPLTDWNFDIYAQKGLDVPAVVPDVLYPIWLYKQAATK